MTLEDARQILTALAAVESNKVLAFEFSQLVANFDLISQRRSDNCDEDLQDLSCALTKRAQTLGMKRDLREHVRNALAAFAAFGKDISLLPSASQQPGPYRARFSVGSRVQISSRDALEAFMSTYRLHHAVVPEQLTYAGINTIVTGVSYYHGGDPVYTLESVGSFGWLEACLTATPEASGRSGSRFGQELFEYLTTLVPYWRVSDEAWPLEKDHIRGIGVLRNYGGAVMVMPWNDDTRAQLARFREHLDPLLKRIVVVVDDREIADWGAASATLAPIALLPWSRRNQLASFVIKDTAD
jgi:hypothetical protein